MKWNYANLQRLMNKRIETATIKTLRGENPKLFPVRLYFTLDDGQALECVTAGIVITQCHTGQHSLLTIRDWLDKDYYPVMEIALDRDQPGGVRYTDYQAARP